MRRRSVRTGAWSRRFVEVGDAVDPSAIESADVYRGCVPRVRRAGTRDAVADGWMVWVDRDGERAVASLRAFLPPSSSPPGRRSVGHAYWRLANPAPAAAVEVANKRLALTLGSDPQVANANAIMRLSGTSNHKSEPARPVRIVGERPGAVCLDQLWSACRTLPEAQAPRSQKQRRVNVSSPVTAIAPDEYVRVLLGVDVPASRKIRCPGPHEDRTPSLHAYPTADRGWFCLECGAGGTIYDLAGLVFGQPTPG